MDKNILREAAFKYRDMILFPYDSIVELNGFDAVYAFCEMVGGQYVPSVKTVFIRCLEEAARAEFRGDYKTISRKYGVSERHLRRVFTGK